MLDSKRETTVRIDTLRYESNRRVDRGDEQFRWLVCPRITNLLGIVVLLVKTI